MPNVTIANVILNFKRTYIKDSDQETPHSFCYNVLLRRTLSQCQMVVSTLCSTVSIKLVFDVAVTLVGLQ